MEFEYMERIQKVESKIMVFCDDQERRINKVTSIFENIKQAESENASELVEIKTKTYRELESLAEKIDLQTSGLQNAVKISTEADIEQTKRIEEINSHISNFKTELRQLAVNDQIMSDRHIELQNDFDQIEKQRMIDWDSLTKKFEHLNADLRTQIDERAKIQLHTIDQISEVEMRLRESINQITSQNGKIKSLKEFVEQKLPLGLGNVVLNALYATAAN